MSDVFSTLNSFSTARLEAIYNHAWRNAHNGIKPGQSEQIIGLIEVICFKRSCKITGRGGTFEFKSYQGQQGG